MTSEEKANLQAEVKRLEIELTAAKIRLYSKDKNEDGAKSLQFWRWTVWATLLVFVLGAALWAVFVILNWTTAAAPLQDFSLAAAVGILGSALSGLMSLNERVANGWEFEDGSREPDPGEKKERFNTRLTNGFLGRPFLGLVSGPLVLAGIKLGQFVHESAPAQADDQRYRIVFFCILGGLFAKTLFDWLKDVFKKLLGK